MDHLDVYVSIKDLEKVEQIETFVSYFHYGGNRDERNAKEWGKAQLGNTVIVFHVREDL